MLKRWCPISGSFQQRLWNIYLFIQHLVPILPGTEEKAQRQPDLCWEGDCLLVIDLFPKPASPFLYLCVAAKE